MAMTRCVALEPAALQAAREQVRSNYFAKNVEAIQSSKLVLAVAGLYQHDLLPHEAHHAHSPRSVELRSLQVDALLYRRAASPAP